MRRIVYLLALPFLLSATKSEAQSFTMQHDTIRLAASGFADVNNPITNQTSNAITVGWRIIYENMPQSWKDHAGFGLCDNVTCYDKAILSGTTQIMDTISAGNSSLFKVQLNATSQQVTPTTSGPVFITAELSESTTTDTVTFVIYKWATAINKVSASQDEVILYPNPAYSEVNVTFSRDLGVKNIAIYNLVGKQISTYRVSGNSAKLDLEKFPDGIYFLRLVDNNGRIVATRRFTHQ